MEKYKITISKIILREDKDYPLEERIYEQMVEKLDVRDLVSYINDELTG
jgi:hypothetical protein